MWRGVSLADDLSPEDRIKQGELKAVNALARSLKIKSSVKNLTITIQDKQYSYSEIHNLPHHLSLARAKTQETPDGWAFQSCHAPMSNLYPCEIPYENHFYDSVERAFQHQMAQRCHDDDLADKILTLDTAFECMVAAKGLRKTAEIEEGEEDLMYDLQEIKYTNNQSLESPSSQHRSGFDAV